jgi:hypothetical protein
MSRDSVLTARFERGEILFYARAKRALTCCGHLNDMGLTALVDKYALGCTVERSGAYQSPRCIMVASVRPDKVAFLE